MFITDREYEEYMVLKKKNTTMRKKMRNHMWYCPVCGYVVDDFVPIQNYCDRCGQKLK